jgi:glycosyltransferase involved in cell wall biosynthesis
VPALHALVPHFNEASTLRTCLGRIADAGLPTGWWRRIVVVDDRSDDSAWAEANRAVEAYRSADRRVDLVRHERNRGKGAAVRTGLSMIASDSEDADAVVLQDADLEYDPVDHRRLLAAHESGAAAVFGSRWRQPDAAALGPLQRLGNLLLTRISNRLTGQRLTDMECGLKLLSLPAIRRILPDLDEEGFGIEPQIAAALARHGLAVAEVPVSYRPRGVAEGKKIRPWDGVRAIRVILRERRRTRSASGASA